MDADLQAMERMLRADPSDQVLQERIAHVKRRADPGAQAPNEVCKSWAIAAGEAWGKQTLFHRRLRNSDGTPVRARVNGRCKTWSRRPADWRLPMKHGLRECFYLGPKNAWDWSLDEREAAL